MKDEWIDELVKCTDIIVAEMHSDQENISYSGLEMRIAWSEGVKRNTATPRETGKSNKYNTSIGVLCCVVLLSTQVYLLHLSDC